MAAQLIEPTQTIEVKQLCCLIYGQPGARKSSTAQTAEAPFTLAFDPGIYRAFGRKACALFDTWDDVATLCNDADRLAHSGELPQDDNRAALAQRFVASRTIVLDTVGMAMELMSSFLIRQNVKNDNRAGGLSLQGYGALKTLFASWIAPLRQRGQDLVMICHEDSEKNGDEKRFIPSIVGGSYNTVMNVADIVGYMHFEQGKRVIDFTPTDRWMAKVPPCGFKQTVLPDFASQPDFLAKILATAKASMGQISADSASLASTVGEWQTWLAGDPALAEFNARLPEMKKMAGPMKTQVWALVQEHAKAAALVFDKGTNTFVQPVREEAQQ